MGSRRARHHRPRRAEHVALQWKLWVERRVRHALLDRPREGSRRHPDGSDTGDGARRGFRNGCHAGGQLSGASMTSRHIIAAATLAIAFTAFGASAQNSARRDFDAEYRAAVQGAQDAAGFEFLGTLVRTCLLPQSGGENTADNVPDYIANPAKAPARDTWYAEPAKVFDDLYFVGGKVHSSWALTTRDGIILIDTIFPYNSEELIVGGMQKLGLDPKQIKYIIMSHAHADHIGGAEMLQKKYGAKVVMGAPDWASVEKYPNRYKTMAPKRDIVATDGMKITLGGRTVTIWLTPGHTPGTLSYTFTALDRGRTVNVAYSGGTAFNLDRK